MGGLAEAVRVAHEAQAALGAAVAAQRALRAQVAAWRTRYGYKVSGERLLLALAAWTRMHGLVSLGLVGQLAPFFGDANELYQWEIDRLIEAAGLPVGAGKTGRGNRRRGRT